MLSHGQHLGSLAGSVGQERSLGVCSGACTITHPKPDISVFPKDHSV